jgi:predicted negative regulator of RcsB-dependent stress response
VRLSTIAPSDRKHALTDGLAEARVLIADGEYEAALDRLTAVREIARAQGDAQALTEIRRLARAVWRRAPRASAGTERADELMRGVMDDLALQAEPQRPALPTSSRCFAGSCCSASCCPS